MNDKKIIGIGLVGLGGISSKHIGELLKCEDAKIVALCDINTDTLAKKSAQLGIPDNKCYTDYLDLINDIEVDAVEVMTPNNLHAKIAIAALKRGKHVNLEKPVAMNYAEALEIVAAKENSQSELMTCFSYRFRPAVRYAKHLVDSGVLGDIVGLNVSYLKDSALWEGRPLEWRFIKSEAGSGVLGDLGVHLIDLAQLLAGKVTEVCATKKTIVTERPLLDGSRMGKSETDDSCGFLAAFECGAEGTFNITRCAIGNKNTIKYDVYGTRGSISFNLNDPSIIDLCAGDGDPKNLSFETVRVPEEFYLDQERAFIDLILGKRDALLPTVYDGAESQLVIDSIIKSSEERRWIQINM